MAGATDTIPRVGLSGRPTEASPHVSSAASNLLDTAEDTGAASLSDRWTLSGGNRRGRPLGLTCWCAAAGGTMGTALWVGGSAAPQCPGVTDWQ